MGQTQGSLTVLINRNHQESLADLQIKYDLILATLLLSHICLHFFTPLLPSRHAGCGMKNCYAMMPRYAQAGDIQRKASCCEKKYTAVRAGSLT